MEDVQYLCRICLDNLLIKQVISTPLDNIISLSVSNGCEDVRLSEMISYSIGIKMPMYVGTSNCVCDVCLRNIRASYTLKKQCEIAQTKFINCPVLEDDPLGIIKIEDFMDAEEDFNSYNRNKMLQEPFDVTETTTINELQGTKAYIKKGNNIPMKADHENMFLENNDSRNLVQENETTKCESQNTNLSNNNYESQKIVQTVEQETNLSNNNNNDNIEIVEKLEPKKEEEEVVKITDTHSKDTNLQDETTKKEFTTDQESKTKRTKEEVIKISEPSYSKGNKIRDEKTKQEYKMVRESKTKPRCSTTLGKMHTLRKEIAKNIDLTSVIKEKFNLKIKSDHLKSTQPQQKTDQTNNEVDLKSIKKKFISKLKCDDLKTQDETEDETNVIANKKVIVKLLSDDLKKGNYKCVHCTKAFYSKKNLMKHMKTVHENKNNCRCDRCRRQIGKLNYLRVIMRQHFGEQPYECTLCDDSFKQPGLLRLHMSRFHNAAE